MPSALKGDEQILDVFRLAMARACCIRLLENGVPLIVALDSLRTKEEHMSVARNDTLHTEA
jgi:hypothetical protein